MMTRYQFSVIVLYSVLLCTGCAVSGSYRFGDFRNVGESAPHLADHHQTQRIVIIGGSRGIGLETAKLALERGHKVTIISRNPSDIELSHNNLTVTSGNILNAASMRSVIANHDVVISAIGLPAGSTNVTLFSEGIQHVIPAMRLHEISRLLTISAIGAGDSKGHGGLLFDWFLQPFVLSSDINDKTKQEQIIKRTDLDYTIVRPAILTDQVANKRYRVIQNYQGVEAGTISRADVAHFLIASIENNLYLKQTVVLSD